MDLFHRTIEFSSNLCGTFIGKVIKRVLFCFSATSSWVVVCLARSKFKKDNASIQHFFMKECVPTPKSISTSSINPCYTSITILYFMCIVPTNAFVDIGHICTCWLVSSFCHTVIPSIYLFILLNRPIDYPIIRCGRRISTIVIR